MAKQFGYRKVQPTTCQLDVETWTVCDEGALSRALGEDLSGADMVEVWERAATGQTVIRVSDADGQILHRSEGSAFDQHTKIGHLITSGDLLPFDDAETGDLSA